MIEIVAKLIREQTPIFLCGEIVECLIDFTNPVQDQDFVSQSSESVESLAWASVQIFCYRKTAVHEKTTAVDITTSKQSTSLSSIVQRPDDVLFSTKPKIIFCDLRLNSGQTKSYMYREMLPEIGPPTYRGHRIKYYYRVAIATQRVNSKVHSLNVPIRVLPLPNINIEESTLCGETNEELAPSNPFLEDKKTETKVEIIWHHLLNITARRLPKFYRISNKRGHVGRFCIFKSAYKLGEDIVGTLDFTSKTIRCCQISVTLQSEEIVQNNAPAISLDNSLPVQSTPGQSETPPSEIEGKITNYSNYHEVCLGMLQTQIIVPVPLYVTPSFKTDMVDVRWRLNFQFVTTDNYDYTPDPETGDWKAPIDIPVETMIWNLPVTLYPTAPLQIFQPSGIYSIIVK